MASSWLLVVSLIAFSQVFITDAQDDCFKGNSAATSTPQRFQSFAYPMNYLGNRDCQLTITATGSNVVHVSSVDMQLAGDKDNCQDKIEFFEGTIAAGNLIATACGKEMVSVQSTGQVLSIRFTSDGYREDKGFVLQYFEGPSYNSECSAGSSPITVGMNPVFLHLPHIGANNIPTNCDYKFTGANGEFVMAEIQDWSAPEGLECNKGKMEVYDGMSSGGTRMVEACGHDQPFFKVASQNNELSVKFSGFSASTPSMKQFTLKVVSYTKQNTDCNIVNKFDLHTIPSYFWFPIFTTTANAICSKKLLVGDGDTVRLTAESCGGTMPFTTAYPENCVDNQGQYQSTTNSFDLIPSAQTGLTPVLLSAASFEPECNGDIKELMASDSMMTNVKLEDLQRRSSCMWRLKAPNTDGVVSATIKSTLQADECISFYNGMDGSTPRLVRQCGAFEKKVTSDQQYLTLSLMTNSQDTMGEVELKFYSMNKTAVCMEHNILATRQKTELTTPNYPSEYPLETLCKWRFVSYRPDFVVVLEVIESDLPEDCSDRAFVNDGELNDVKTTMGEWCGGRTPVYRGSGQTLLLTFDSDHVTMMTKKGFKFRYYADYKEAREMVEGTDVLLIAGVLTIVVLACGFIFITYRLCTEKSRKRKARKADRQPITE